MLIRILTRTSKRCYGTFHKNAEIPLHSNFKTFLENKNHKKKYQAAELPLDNIGFPSSGYSSGLMTPILVISSGLAIIISGVIQD